MILASAPWCLDAAKHLLHDQTHWTAHGSWLSDKSSLSLWTRGHSVAIFCRLIVALNRVAIRGYFFQGDCGHESAWLFLAIRGYFFGRGYFFSRGHFCSFFVAIFLKCRKYRQKNSRVAIFCWCAWLFFVAIRGYPWLFFVFVAISNIPWLFFSWLFFWTAVNTNILTQKNSRANSRSQFKWGVVKYRK